MRCDFCKRETSSTKGHSLFSEDGFCDCCHKKSENWWLYPGLIFLLCLNLMAFIFDPQPLQAFVIFALMLALNAFTVHAKRELFAQSTFDIFPIFVRRKKVRDVESN